MATDIKKVTKDANVRTPDAEYEGHEIRKLGSRVTSKQAELVLGKITQSLRRTLTEGDEALANLRAYADTGDKSYVSNEQFEALQKVVSQCKQDAPGGPEGSAARRFWPRKTAAIVVAHVEPYAVEETESADESAAAAA